MVSELYIYFRNKVVKIENLWSWWDVDGCIVVVEDRYDFVFVLFVYNKFYYYCYNYLYKLN